MPFAVKIFIILVFIAGNCRASFQAGSIIQYEKSFWHSNRKNILAVSRGSYSEIRYDKNGDGIIDVWFFSNGQLNIEENFKNGRLTEVVVEKRKLKHIVKLIYLADAKYNLHLSKMLVREFGTYFDAQAIPDYLEESQDKACQSTPMQKALESSGWKDFVCKTSELERTQRLEKLLSKSCQQLPLKEKIAFEQSLKTLYSLDVSKAGESNKLVSCLSKSPKTQPILPKFLSRTLTDLEDPDGFHYECIPSAGAGCAQGKYLEGLPGIQIPTPGPMCKVPPDKLFEEKIVHEYMHRLMPEALQDDSIKNIIDACIYGKLDELENVKIENLANIKNVTELSPSGIKKAVNESNNAQPPPNTQKLAAQPGSLIVDSVKAGIGLNSGFGSKATASGSFNPNLAYRESVARTAPMFPIFEAAASKVVPRANAGTLSWTASRAGGSETAKWLNSEPATTSSIANAVGVAQNGSDSSAIRRSPSFEGQTESSSGNSKILIASRSAREVASTGSGGSVSAKVRNGSAANISLGGGAGTANQGELDSSQSRPQLSSKEKKVANEIVQNVNSAKSIDEVMALLAKNDKRLKELKIHVYDPRGVNAKTKRDTYGLPTLDGAAQSYTLINGKLVPE